MMSQVGGGGVIRLQDALTDAWFISPSSCVETVRMFLLEAVDGGIKFSEVLRLLFLFIFL